MTNGLLRLARGFFRTVGPQPDSEFVSVNNCTRCKKNHRTYLCHKCGLQFWDRWRMQVHIICNTRQCNLVADQRARVWANQ